MSLTPCCGDCDCYYTDMGLFGLRGCHSWNPLIVLFSLCDPLMEDYKYDRKSSVLILKIQVYACRILSSISGTSRVIPSAGFVCI